MPTFSKISKVIFGGIDATCFQKIYNFLRLRRQTFLEKTWTRLQETRVVSFVSILNCLFSLL